MAFIGKRIVLLDGIEIQNKVHRVEIDFAVADIPQVELHIHAKSVIVDADGNISITTTSATPK